MPVVTYTHGWLDSPLVKIPIPFDTASVCTASGLLQHGLSQTYACIYSIRAVLPGVVSVHHPNDASLKTPLCQHLAHSLAGCHITGGTKLALQGTLFGGTQQHRDWITVGKHLCCHVVLGAPTWRKFGGGGGVDRCREEGGKGKRN